MQLDARERHFLIPSPRSGLRLFLRHLAPTRVRTPERKAVLYIHGATFPSALSIAHRFDGRSWRDALCEAGFHVWGLDFLGYGGSDRYPEMDEPAESHAPLGVAEEAGEQIIAAVRFLLEQEQLPRISVIAHSWGAMPAVRFAGNRPSWVDRLVLFAPIVPRASSSTTDALTAVPLKREITLSRGTHLMHLESGRHALHRESACFLLGEE